MNTLYIDTHSEKIVLILFQNNQLLKKLEQNSSFHQSSIIIPLLRQLLEETNLSIHDIKDIILINGPGSFTGVRLGVTIGKTLSYTLNVPIRVMSSILIKAVSNKEKGHHWFVEEEKNGYYVGEFNDLDELLNDYFYIKKSEYESFKSQHDIIDEVELDYQAIYDFSRDLPIMSTHGVKPLYIKLIEVQK